MTSKPENHRSRSWVHLAGLIEVIELTYCISAATAVKLLREGIKRGMASTPCRVVAEQPAIAHRVEVARPRSLTPRCGWHMKTNRPMCLLSARDALSVNDFGGVGAIDWTTGTIMGHPIELDGTTLHEVICWYWFGPGEWIEPEGGPAASPPHHQDGQMVLRKSDPPRTDYRRDDALLYGQIDTMLAADPRMAVTGAVRLLVAAGKVKGTNTQPASKLRRLVKGYLASRPTARHRSG